MAYHYIFTLSLLVMIAVTLVLLGVLVWSWGAFLDFYEHDPGRVRAVMFLVLVLTMSTELGLAAHGIIYPWVAWVSIVVNLWGGLDAILRYPAAHDLESFFALKQIVLLVTKTIVYAFGFQVFRQNITYFLLVLAFNIWALPLLYFMALPLDPAEQVVQDDEYDVDLTVRMWQLAVCSSERRRCLASCRTWLNRRLVGAAESSRLACFAICVASPQHRRSFKHSGRSV